VIFYDVEATNSCVRFEGEWKMIGTFSGKFTWPSGDVYQGTIQDGKKHGKGTLTWSDGSKYEGEWKNGVRAGKGEYVWPDGRKFKGAWKGSWLAWFGCCMRLKFGY